MDKKGFSQKRWQLCLSRRRTIGREGRRISVDRNLLLLYCPQLPVFQIKVISGKQVDKTTMTCICEDGLCVCVSGARGCEEKDGMV